MTIKYTGVEVALDDQTVFKVGNFLIQKKSDSTLNIFLIPKDVEKIENIEGMLSYNFTNALPSYAVCNPNGYMVGDSARERAEKEGEPLGTIFTTTAGKKGDGDGKFFHTFVSASGGGVGGGPGGGVCAASFAFGNSGKSYKLLHNDSNANDHSDGVSITGSPTGGKQS